MLRLQDQSEYAVNGESIQNSELTSLTDIEIKNKYPDRRTKVKPATFCIPYGGSGYTIAQNIQGLTPEQGEWIYNEYMKKFSGLNKYFEKVKEESINNGYVLINSTSGRKWFFPYMSNYHAIKQRLESYSTGKKGYPFQGLSAGYWDRYKQEKQSNSSVFKEMKTIQSDYFKLRGKMSRIGLNAPIQGSSADISKLAGIKMFRWIINNGYFNKVKICVPLHDEYCVEAPEEIIDKVSIMVQESMESAAKKFCPTVTIKAKPVISDSWEH